MSKIQAEIEARIREKMADHVGSMFTPEMDMATKVIMTLFRDYPGLEQFTDLVTMVPKVILGWDSSIYITEEGGSRAVMAASTCPDYSARLDAGEKIFIDIPQEPCVADGCYLFPLRSNFPRLGEEGGLTLEPIVGAISICSGQLSDDHYYFLHQYSLLAGSAIVHRLLTLKNSQHISFIRKLVADIGHNVIVPNIFFKAYLRRLSGKIARLVEIQDQLRKLASDPTAAIRSSLLDLSEEMGNANEGLLQEFNNIKKHYQNTSLFLETLLRESHFEAGRYVLKKRSCNFRKDIIDPQLEQYGEKLKARNIEIDLSMGGVPDKPMEAVVDIGLISQVFANYLSNAVKYTRPAPGTNRKFIAYGLELIPDIFGPMQDGVKINLFSSGQPLTIKEADDIFREGFRGTNVERERGTGHGLFFVKEVVESHGGLVGCEPTTMGNNFYFVLPR